MATLRTEFPCPLAKLKIVINLMKSSQSPNVKRLTRTKQRAAETGGISRDSWREGNVQSGIPRKYFKLSECRMFT